MDPIKLSIEEVNSILELQGTYQSITHNLGKIQLERKNLDKAETDLYDDYAHARARETVLIADLQRKYGEGSIDMSDYTFIPDPKV